MPKPVRILIIAGSDSGGGAGIQADIKTVTALGGYAATAITAITVQDTTKVHAVHPIPPEVVADQIRVVLKDIGADAIKTGMLGSTAHVHAVAEAIAAYGRGAPLVVDPVMVAKDGSPLLEPAAEAALMARLVPRATMVTPNLPEAARLTGLRVASPTDIEAAARELVKAGAKSALVKGGHLSGPEIVDILANGGGKVRAWTDDRIATSHTHGTGCTLASAIAVGLAEGLDAAAAVTRARRYLRRAIEGAPGFGAGHGPLDHAWPAREAAMAAA